MLNENSLHIFTNMATPRVVLTSGAPERILANSTKILLKGEEAPLDVASRNEINKVCGANGSVW